MSKQRKYEFTGKIKTVFGIEFKQIRAIIDFGCIVAGEIGGWIESEDNLSQSGNAWVSGNARVYGNAWVYGDARVSGNAWVYGNAWVSGNAEVYGDARVSGNAEVYGDARVSGNAWVYGDARVSGDAEVKESCDYMVFGPAGRYNRFTTFFKCKDKAIKVACGCFFGTIIEFREKVKETHKGSKHERVYLAMADMTELQLDDDAN